MFPEKFLYNSLIEDFNFKANCDIYESDNMYHIDMDIPGFLKNEINIECHKGTITIKAEREINDDEENKKYIRRERKYTKVERSFYFSDIVEDQIKANYDGGILHITVPLKPEGAKKQISVE